MNATPTAMPVVFLLSSTGFADGANPAVTLGQGLPTEHNGLPIHYRWGSGVKIGHKYEHPSGKYEVDASAANVGKMERNFAKMKERGVSIPIVKDHKLTADNSMGGVYGTRRHNGWFQPLLGFYGDDELKTAQKNRISLGIKPHMKDGQGNDYDFAMEHVAVTPIPVVDNQPGLLAASRGEDGERPVLLLSAASTTPQRSQPMKPEHRKRLLACMSGVKGMSNDMDDENLMSLALDHHEKMMRDIPKAAAYNANLSRQNDELIEAVTSAQRTIDSLNLSRVEPNETAAIPDDNTCMLLSHAFDVELESVVTAGGADQACAEKIKALYIANGKPKVIALSREGDDITPHFSKLLAALKDNKPSSGATGVDQTGFQMSRQTPGGASNPDNAKAIRERMIEKASNGAKKKTA